MVTISWRTSCISGLYCPGTIARKAGIFGLNIASTTSNMSNYLDECSTDLRPAVRASCQQSCWRDALNVSLSVYAMVGMAVTKTTWPANATSTHTDLILTVCLSCTQGAGSGHAGDGPSHRGDRAAGSS